MAKGYKVPEIRQPDFWTQWPEELQKWLRETLGIDLYEDFADSDWTLVVKLHAMIEAALNSAILAKINAPELDEVVAKLPTSDMKTGKVAFAKALKILDPECATFMQQLSELRNFCVHDIRHFNF